MNTLPCLVFLFLSTLVMPLTGAATDGGKRHSGSSESRLREKGLSSEERLKIYDEVSWDYLDKDFRKSSEIAREGIRFAREHTNPVMEATLMRNLGVAYYMDNRLDSAQVILLEALRISRSTGDPSPEAGVYVALGNLYNVQSRYDLAIENYLKALPIYQELGRTDRVYVINSNIGALYSNRRNYPKAEKYLLDARQAAIAAGDSGARGRISQNLSNVYFVLSRPAEAYRYAEEAVRLCREAGDTYNEVLALTSLSGACHTHLHDNHLAMAYALEALGKARQVNIPGLIAASLRNVSFTYYRVGDYREALRTAKECLELTDSTDLPQRIAMHSTLLESYIQLGRKTEAEQAYHEVYDLMTRQSDEQVSYATSEMEVKYETRKKELHIASLSREKNLLGMLSAALAVAVVGLVAALVLYNRYQRQRRLRTEERMRAFETQKQLLAAEWLLDGENRERARLSRELHDGLGGALTVTKLKLSQADAPESLIMLMDNAIAEMRRISSNLMPEMLGRSGLRATLGEYCQATTVVEPHFYGEDARYDLSIEMNLYRIACELITNAIRHAEATRVNLQLITEKERISLTIQDNGKGFDTATASGNGLNNIRSRVSLMGATLDLFSTPGSGTEISVELKITPAI